VVIGGIIPESDAKLLKSGASPRLHSQGHRHERPIMVDILNLIRVKPRPEAGRVV